MPAPDNVRMSYDYSAHRVSANWAQVPGATGYMARLIRSPSGETVDWTNDCPNPSCVLYIPPPFAGQYEVLAYAKGNDTTLISAPGSSGVNIIGT